MWRGSRHGARPSKGETDKVARKLKYYSPETDYAALQRELQAKQRDNVDVDDEQGEDLEDWRKDIPSATDDDWFN